ncbi:hypothetical protein WMY93_029839 [Mugilogobius chulae]|uniref:Uncharacterized protein n=1 Tax=Mugilogobius chulae TaxID=88201 RepID=A0AAW0MM47_9GOBI
MWASPLLHITRSGFPTLSSTITSLGSEQQDYPRDEAARSRRRHCASPTDLPLELSMHRLGVQGILDSSPLWQSLHFGREEPILEDALGNVLVLALRTRMNSASDKPFVHGVLSQELEIFSPSLELLILCGPGGDRVRVKLLEWTGWEVTCK